MTEILRVLKPDERTVFEPLVENFRRAQRALFLCAQQFEPRMSDPAVAFDPDTFVFTRTTGSE